MKLNRAALEIRAALLLVLIQMACFDELYLLLLKFLQCFQIIIWKANIVALPINHQPQETIFLPQAIKRRCQLELTMLTDIIINMFLKIIE